MPFMKGPAPWRRTLQYLQAGKLVFKDKVKIMSINYHETLPESDGLRRFIFWHLSQIQYKNPNVQCIQFKNQSRDPFITIYTHETDKDVINKIHVNCYKRDQEDILDWCIKVAGKTQEQLAKEAAINPANFGRDCSRYCICEVEGQVACPSFKPLPKFMMGKYTHYKKEDLEEVRKVLPDQEALKQYWNSA